VTDIKIYEPVERVQYHELVNNQESCGICLIKFHISNNNQEKVMELVKSKIENLLEEEEETGDDSDTIICRDMHDKDDSDGCSSDSSRDSVEIE